MPMIIYAYDMSNSGIFLHPAFRDHENKKTKNAVGVEQNLPVHIYRMTFL